MIYIRECPNFCADLILTDYFVPSLICTFYKVCKYSNIGIFPHWVVKICLSITPTIFYRPSDLFGIRQGKQ